MGGFVRGDVVIVPFPFSDLSAAKRRPTLVIAELEGDDVILCQITSRARRGPHVIPLSAADFAQGGLRHDSFIRPDRVFTADSAIVLYRAGALRPEKVQEVATAIARIVGA